MKLTPLQHEVLAQITRAHITEAAAQAEAELEARELIRSKIANARATTNSLMYAAVTRHKLPKAAVTGAHPTAPTSRIQTDKRLEEHRLAQGIMPDSPVGAAQTVGLTVTLEGSSVLVRFDAYLDLDLSPTPITGTIELDAESGDLKDRTGDIVDLLETDLLLAVKVWGLPEVQAAL